MPMYLQIALGIALAVLLLTRASELKALLDQIIKAILQVVHDVLRTLEHIFSAAFRAFAR